MVIKDDDMTDNHNNNKTRPMIIVVMIIMVIHTQICNPLRPLRKTSFFVNSLWLYHNKKRVPKDMTEIS